MQLSFAKRRNGLIKKALELYMVCGVDVVFIAFSPSGRLSYYCGDKRVEDVLSRFLKSLSEETQQFHIPDLELQILLDILRNLRHQTEEHIKRDRTIWDIQKELAQVKEEIQVFLFETRRYKPLQEAIMSTEEANRAEQILEKQLASVRERKKEIIIIDDDSGSDTEKHSKDAPQPSECEKHKKGASRPSNSENQNKGASQTSDSGKIKKDAPQPSNSEKLSISAPQPFDFEKLKKDAPQPSDSLKMGSKGSFSNRLEEVRLAKAQKKPYDDSYNNNQHKLPRVESSSNYKWMDQRSSLQNSLPKDSTLQLHKDGPLSYTSLLTAPDVTETLFPTTETVVSQSPVQNIRSSFLQNSTNLFRDAAFDSDSYSNWNSTGINQPPSAPLSNDQRTYGTGFGSQFPKSQSNGHSTYGTANGFKFLNPQSNDRRTYGTGIGSQFPKSQSSDHSKYGIPNGFEFMNPQSNDLGTYGTAIGSQYPNSQSNDLSAYGTANAFPFSNPQSYDISTYGTTSSFPFPKSSLTSLSLQPPSLSTSFEVPSHQIQFPVHASNYYHSSQPMPHGSSSNVSLFSGPQWCDVRNLQPNPTPFSDFFTPEPSFLDLPNSVSGLNMYSDSGSSALFSRPSNPQMNLQPIGGQNEPSLSLTLQGPYSDYYDQQPQLKLQGSSSAPKVNLYKYDEQERSSSAPKMDLYNYIEQPGSSSAPKRKVSWGNDDVNLRLSSYHLDESATYTDNTILPAPRLPANAIYDSEYEMLGLPVDPYLRKFYGVPDNDDDNLHQE